MSEATNFGILWVQ